MKKSVLITGASKGIGKDLAKVFAKNGYSLILIARTTLELENLKNNLLQEYQCEVKILSVDLNQMDSVDIICNTFSKELSDLDILINNAGYGIMKKFHELDESDVDGIVNVNMRALTKLTYRILPYMLAKKSGKILNVASTAAFVPGPYMAMYFASKAFVLSLSEALFEEYRKDGITVSTLCPGVTRTSFQKRAGMENSRMVSGMLPIMSSDTVAKMAYDGLLKNKRVIVTGWFNKVTILLMRFIPNSIILKFNAMLEKSR